MSAHPYHPMCGCWLCCKVDEAAERADEQVPESDPLEAVAYYRGRLPGEYRRQLARAMQPVRLPRIAA